MKFGLVLVALMFVMASVYAIGCAYDATPNVWSDLKIRCQQTAMANAKCYVTVNNTDTGMIVAIYPAGTFDYDREKFIVPDSGGVFAIVAPLGGEYEAKTNYTLNVTCFNTTARESSAYNFTTTIARPPNFIGEIGEWSVVNGRYLFFGLIFLFLSATLVFFALRRH